MTGNPKAEVGIKKLHLLPSTTATATTTTTTTHLSHDIDFAHEQRFKNTRYKNNKKPLGPARLAPPPKNSCIPTLRDPATTT